MNKINRKSILLLAAAGALTLTGCSTTAGTSAPASFPNTIRVENAESSNAITASGSEKVMVVPDVADIQFGVTTEAADAQTCQAQNAQETNKVIEFLKNAGIAETSIQTNGYNLNPKYDWSDNKQVLTGYDMTTNITVTSLALDQVGTILNDSVNAGVNYISSVAYRSSKYDESYQEALKLAIAMAKTKAEAMAEASGRTLGMVTNVEELRSNQTGRAISYAAGAAAKEDAVMNAIVMPGELEVEASVVVKFGLEQ